MKMEIITRRIGKQDNNMIMMDKEMSMTCKMKKEDVNQVNRKTKINQVRIRKEMKMIIVKTVRNHLHVEIDKHNPDQKEGKSIMTITKYTNQNSAHTKYL